MGWRRWAGLLLAMPLACRASLPPSEAPHEEPVPSDEERATADDGESPAQPRSEEEPIASREVIGSELGPLPPEPAAVVGDTTISLWKFRAIYDLKLQKYADRGRTIPRSADRRYRRSIAERLIIEEGTRQLMAEAELTVPAGELDARLRQQQSGIRDWQAHLARRGESDASLRAMFLRELQMDALLDARGQLKITPDELQAEYAKVAPKHDVPRTRVRIRRILVTWDGRQQSRTKVEASRVANDAAKEAHAPGAEFDELVEMFSDVPPIHTIIDVELLPHEVVRALEKLQPGETTGVVDTHHGFYVVRLDGRWGPGPLPIEALEPELRRTLAQRKRHEGHRALKQEILGRPDIQSNILDSVPRPQPGRPGAPSIEVRVGEGPDRRDSGPRP